MEQNQCYQSVMNRQDEREVVALSSLHDISDYSNYIDQRIIKLNNLYQSLSLKPRNRNSSLRNPVTSTLGTLAGSKPYRTGRIGQSSLQVEDPMYKTDYLSKKQRHFGRLRYDNDNQLQSLTLSNFRNTLELSRSKIGSKKEKKILNQRLEIYKEIKNDILGTFYVGGRTIYSEQQTLPVNRGLLEIENPRPRRGKLWHGRPPVKIIEKYD